MKVHVLHTGRVLIDGDLAFREKTVHLLPYSGWLRGKKKNFLISYRTPKKVNPCGYGVARKYKDKPKTAFGQRVNASMKFFGQMGICK
ncbi:hypothetical protein [Peribacillus sp. SCS-155]|uniref:hypothetical protein n=1 Tax=Peribacillus sedimenti TaxID=3115297 RepID=UPI0039069321